MLRVEKGWARRAVLCAVVSSALVATTEIASAVEIIPAAGMTKTVDGDEDPNAFGSLSFRGQTLPFLATEIGLAYRSESRFDNNLNVRMWPVTASLWLTPIPSLYAGGGVGWYNVTLDFSDDVSPPLEDETNQEFGIHVGGGVRVPLGTNAALDLNGRYVMMRDQEARLVPETFDPDFWSTALGLAIKF